MIPDYKCRSRQKTNRRELVAANNPSQRLFFPRGIRAGAYNMHINTNYRTNMCRNKIRVDGNNSCKIYIYIPIF